MLIEGLDERQSVEVMLALHRAGVPARRSAGENARQKTFTVSVNEDAYITSLQVLQDYGFPRKKGPAINEVIERKGFSPIARELSEFRLDYALSLQIEQLLQGLPDIVEAKAVIRSNLGRDLRKEERATASVTVRYLAQIGAESFDEGLVREIVARSVPSLSKDDIEIVASPVNAEGGIVYRSFGKNEIGTIESLSALRPFHFSVPQSHRALAVRELTYYSAFCVISGVVLGIFVGVYYPLWRRARKREKEGAARDTAASSLLIETPMSDKQLGITNG